jgi:hypothetical protein
LDSLNLFIIKKEESTEPSSQLLRSFEALREAGFTDEDISTLRRQLRGIQGRIVNGERKQVNHFPSKSKLTLCGKDPLMATITSQQKTKTFQKTVTYLDPCSLGLD